MGFVYMMGVCYGCKRPFSFHPNLVPSLRINGVREPFCQSCLDKANPVRIENGLEPLVALPGAYEPCPEDELI